MQPLRDQQKLSKYLLYYTAVEKGQVCPPFINTIIWGDSPVALAKLKWEERAIKRTPEGEFIRYSLKLTFLEDFVRTVLYHSRHPDLPSTLSSCYCILLSDLRKKSTLIAQEQLSMMSNHTLSSEASVS